VVGACSVTFLSLGNATLQLGSEPAMRGRVMSLWSVAFLGSTPIGGPLVGFIGGSLGARYGLGLGGVAALAAAMYGRLALRHQGQTQLGAVSRGDVIGMEVAVPAIPGTAE
jgi:hypothetical protein